MTRPARLITIRQRRPRFFALLLSAAFIAGCAHHSVISSVPSTPQPVPEPAPPAKNPTGNPPPRSAPRTRPAPPANPVAGAYAEQGVASWYGAPFDGRRAADGEIFDMNQLVAAHRTLPFGSIVRVTNLNNGRYTNVRIIDRGPFVEGRVIDLALAAARALDMVATGTAPVRIELVSGQSPDAGEFTIQVGAFADRSNAERLRGRLLTRYQPIFIQEFDAPSGHFYRVRVGRVPTTDAAQQLAAQLHTADGFETFVVRLDQPN